MLAVVAMTIRVAAFAAAAGLIQMREFWLVLLGGGQGFSSADDRSEADRGIGSPGSRSGACSRR